MAITIDRETTAKSATAPTNTATEQRIAPWLTSLPAGAAEKEPRSIGLAVALHTLIFGSLLWGGSHAIKPVLRQQQAMKVISLHAPDLEPHHVLPSVKSAGGGGGAHDIAPVTAGHLPKPSPTPVVSPSAPPKIPPRVAVEPTINLQANMRMESSLPNLGVPNGPNVSVSSLGTGNGGGIGSGLGNGLGSGRNGNTGGDTYQVGGDVSAPQVLYKADAEFSEEARKAKFQGEVLVHLIVDANGRPTQIRVIRPVGMGLDEKAREAVAQYKFRAARKNGRPVAVEVNIAVDFQIF